MRDEEYYRILELKPGAGIEEIKGAYRRLAKRYHPDLGGGNDVIFAQLLLAYDRLRRKEEKKAGSALDRSLAQAVRRRDHRTLLRMLSDQTNPEIQVKILHALGQTKKFSIYAQVRRYFQSRDGRVSRAAIECVGMMGSLQAAGELAALYSKSGLETKKAILKTAGKGRTFPEYRKLLEMVRSRETGELRLLAEELLR